jgi:DNA ligase-1
VEIVARLRPAGFGAAAPGASPARAPLLPFEDPPASGPAQDTIRVSPVVADATWAALAAVRAESRRLAVEGLMLKRLTSAYGVGRRRGDWWKWKIDPHTIDAVLIYAQPGSGKRASLLTDYTFGVWHDGELVPVAKAYSGLTNEEILEMDRWIRRHTVERFGPVRHVEPIHVFELGFEAIAPSTRHRSGIAVRFPRMLRWRKDKPASEADTLAALEALMRGEAPLRRGD